MFGCVINSGASTTWPRGMESDSPSALSYHEALKRTIYMADLFYPAVIPLAGTLPPSQVPPRTPAASSDLKFGIDRILGPSKSCSNKEDKLKSEKASTSPKYSTSSASPGASNATTPTPERRSPTSQGREGGHRGGQMDSGQRGAPAKHPAPSPPGLSQDFHLQEHLKFHNSMRSLLPSPHDLAHPPGGLGHPNPHEQFLSAQDLAARGGFSVCPCPGASPPTGLMPYHPSLHPVHLAGLHYQGPPAHRHDYEGNYAIMTTDLPPHRPTSGTQTTQPKRKRSWSRAVFSHLQRKGLEKRFEVQKYVTKPDRKQLAAMLGLTDAQVKVWFQNRRMKWRHAEEAKRKKDETDDVTIENSSTGDVTQASMCVDAPQDSDDDELCIDDVDDDSSRDNNDDITMMDQSSALKS